MATCGIKNQLIPFSKRCHIKETGHCISSKGQRCFRSLLSSFFSNETFFVRLLKKLKLSLALILVPFLFPGDHRLTLFYLRLE